MMLMNGGGDDGQDCGDVDLLYNSIFLVSWFSTHARQS